jgi:hypothetical protein
MLCKQHTANCRACTLSALDEVADLRSALHCRGRQMCGMLPCGWRPPSRTHRQRGRHSSQQRRPLRPGAAPPRKHRARCRPQRSPRCCSGRRTTACCCGHRTTSTLRLQRCRACSCQSMVVDTCGHAGCQSMLLVTASTTLRSVVTHNHLAISCCALCTVLRCCTRVEGLMAF